MKGRWDGGGRQADRQKRLTVSVTVTVTETV